MRVFGLTGGIATGKSTVAALFTKLFDVPVVDADQSARAILEPGTDCWQKVHATFGPSYFLPNKAVDRTRLRQRIIDDPNAKKQLEAITHPAIMAHVLGELKRHVEAGHKYAVVEAALMVETGTWKQYEALFVVSCSRHIQIERLMRRDNQSEAAASAFIDLQMPMEQKETFAHAVIHNNGTLAELERATSAAWHRIIRTV